MIRIGDEGADQDHAAKHEGTETMQTVRLGKNGPDVSRVGLGCMGMSEFYGPADETESLRVFDRALELGINFLDTADVYGPQTNEVLVGQALRGRRERVVLATKFGIVRDPNDPMKRGICGQPDYVKSCCDASLKRLGVDTIDLYYQHRVDVETPIEETVGAMAELVQQGKVRYLGLSEAGAQTLRRLGGGRLAAECTVVFGRELSEEPGIGDTPTGTGRR